MKTNFTLLGAIMIASLAGPLYADNFKLDVEGEITFGVNNQLVDNTYLIGEVEISAGQMFDNGFGWALSYELEGENFGWGDEVDYDDAILFEFITSVGKFAYGDINKKGASELFYDDLSGMALDVVRYKDKYPSVRWHGTVNEQFSYAISSRDLKNDDDEEYSIGLGYKTDVFELGLAWDNGSMIQTEAIGGTVVINKKLGSGDVEYILSYIKIGRDSAFGLGIEVEYENGLTVEASYAFNDVAGIKDGYALSIEYENASLIAEAEYEFDGSEYEYEISLEYKLEKQATLGTTLYVGYIFEEGDPEDTGYYVGAGFGIAKNTNFGVAYSETDKAGDLEVLPGWSAMLNISF